MRMIQEELEQELEGAKVSLFHIKQSIILARKQLENMETELVGSKEKVAQLEQKLQKLKREKGIDC